MSFNFIKEPKINGYGQSVFTFFEKGFRLNGKARPAYIDVILSGVSPLVLTNAIGLNYLKLFGGTEQRNLPSGYTQVEYVTNTVKTWLNTGVKFDFSKNYEIEIRARGTLGSWYMFQAREASSTPTHGISGSSTGDTIIFGFNGSSINTSQISRIKGNIYYIKGTINNGNLTLYVKDETAETEETVTGTYTPSTGTSVNIGLFGNGQTGVGGLQGVAPNTDVYYARLKENDTYIIDYVPCKQTTTAGFYDKVSNTFKTTTDLSAGSDAVPTPETPMDIVSNNGVLKATRNLFDYEYFYDNYIVPPTSTVGRVAIQLSPNTKYTVSTNTQQSSTAAQVWTATGSDPNTFSPVTTANGVLIDTPRTVQSDSNGYIILAIRVGTEYEIKESDFENGNVWVQIEQGSTVTPYAPYSPTGIYADGTVETVEIHSKNLFGGYTTETGYWQSNGTWSTDANYNTYQYITLKPNTTYTISNDIAPDYWRLALFNGNTFSSRLLQQGGTSYTFTTNANENKISIAFNKNNISDVSKVQLEQGSTATTYEPYFNGGQATAEMLLKVGDYQDVQSILDGAVTRNIGIKVLDGSETGWTYSSSSNLFYNLNIITGAVGGIAPICNYFIGIPTSSGRQNGNVYIVRETNRLDFVDNRFTSVNTWKQWLSDQYNAGTPVIIVYPLAESTTESVTGQPLTVQTGTNIVTITQASIDNLTMEVGYKSGVRVTVTEIENVQLSNNVEVTIS